MEHEQPPPRRRPDRRSRRAVLAAAVLALLFVGGTFVAPVLEQRGSGWGSLLRTAYVPLCHQQAQRSLSVGAGTQAVCARCSGLYLGGAIALFACALRVARRRPRPAWLAWAVAPTAIDFFAGLAGLPSLPNVPRLLLALPLGFLASWFLAAGIAELFSSSSTLEYRRPRVSDSRAVEEPNG